MRATQGQRYTASYLSGHVHVQVFVSYQRLLPVFVPREFRIHYTSPHSSSPREKLTNTTFHSLSPSIQQLEHINILEMSCLQSVTRPRITVNILPWLVQKFDLSDSFVSSILFARSWSGESGSIRDDETNDKGCGAA